MRRVTLFFIFCGFLLVSSHASPELCTALRQDYTKRMDVWTAALKQTNDVDTQKKLWQQRPDAMVSVGKLWKVVQPQIHQEWTLEHVGWLLKLLSSQTIKPEEKALIQLRQSMLDQISKAIEDKHWSSKKLAPVCLGLLAVGEQKTLKVLEKIEAQNPSRQMQGVAAACISYQYGQLSDSPEIMKKRLTLLRKAIIESHDVVIDGVTVAQLAEEQLYVIRHLCKGRQAPELMGTDQSGITQKLSQHKGKVVILLFWAEVMVDPEHFLALSRSLKTKYKESELTVLGVFHGDTSSLRRLHAEQFVTWTNLTDPDGSLSKIYRISTPPAACVIDKSGAIQYFGNPGSFAELTADALIHQ